MSLAQTLQDFRNSIIESNGLIVTAHSTDSAGINLWNSNELKFITEQSFLKMFIAWESFIEKSFIFYLMGNPSIRGNVVTRYANPVDEKHAQQILIGVMKYVDWSNPDIIRKFAKLYFEHGEPFETIISSTFTDLMDLKTIRNSSAHSSSTTTTKLESLAIRKLRRPHPGITVYDLILANDPNVSGNTILKTYQSILDTTAELIANY